MLTLNSIVQRSQDVIAAEADKDLVMVSIVNGSYYGVSDVAREVWEQIEQPRKVSDLINELCMNYDVDEATCQAQTLSFLEALMNEKLLRVQNENS
jgi:hypothetical protein